MKRFETERRFIEILLKTVKTIIIRTSTTKSYYPFLTISLEHWAHIIFKQDLAADCGRLNLTENIRAPHRVMRKRSSIFILNIMKLIPHRMLRERRYFYSSIQKPIAINYRAPRSESSPISPMQWHKPQLCIRAEILLFISHAPKCNNSSRLS
jgi:hypothetical protein